jgi:DNA helicase HerA-like ATPase
MPAKMDQELPNKHHFIFGTSGSGKSTFAAGIIRRERPRRIIAWDPDEDYPVNHIRSGAQFTAALKAAWASGKPYKLGLTLDESVANFERFCTAVWAVADARVPTMVIVEELGDVAPSSGNATSAWGRLIRRGRKRGLQIIAISQSPAEIDKTTYKNVGYKCVGLLESEADRKRAAEVLDLPYSDIASMRPYDFYVKQQGRPAEKTRSRKR